MPSSPPFQFGLLAVFILTSAAGVACAVLFVAPTYVAAPVLTCWAMAYPAVLTTFLVYGGSVQRSFCIGALFPAGALMVYTSFGLFVVFYNGDWGQFLEYFGVRYSILVVALSALSGIVGLVCVGVRRWIVGRHSAALGDEVSTQSSSSPLTETCD